jgi:hypothetical protein
MERQLHDAVAAALAGRSTVLVSQGTRARANPGGCTWPSRPGCPFVYATPCRSRPRSRNAVDCERAHRPGQARLSLRACSCFDLLQLTFETSTITARLAGLLQRTYSCSWASVRKHAVMRQRPNACHKHAFPLAGACRARGVVRRSSACRQPPPPIWRAGSCARTPQRVGPRRVWRRLLQRQGRSG